MGRRSSGQRALNTLRSQISRLRRSIGSRIVAGPDGYVIVIRLRTAEDADGPDVLDARRFEAALRRMRADPGPTSRALLAGELAAWRGAAYGELADIATVQADGRSLELARADAAELVARADLAAGRWADAIAEAEAIVASDALREPAWEVLVRSLGAAGRTADAMSAARRAVAALADVGLTPGAGLRAAEAAVLREAPTDTRRERTARPRAPLTPTVGRSTELASVVRALESSRLVTLVGPGGVGKTRLATEVARAEADRHDGGTVLVELARITDPSDVAATVAVALDLRASVSSETAALDELGALDALVVLDNCEHVVDTVAALVPAMLSGGDRLRVLATSREPLAVAGEHVVSIAPLRVTGVDAPAVSCSASGRQRRSNRTARRRAHGPRRAAPRRLAAGVGDGRCPDAHDEPCRAGVIDRRRPRCVVHGPPRCR